MSNPFEILEQRLQNIENILQTLKPVSPAPVPIQDEIGIDEAIELTGLKRSTLYKGSWDGSVPCRKRGKRLVYSRKELQHWQESRTIRKVSPEHKAAEELAVTMRGKRR